MYLSDKIIYILVLFLSKSLKLLAIVSGIVIILMIIAMVLILLTLGNAVIYLPIITVLWSFTVALYALFYIVHDIIEIIILRSNPLHPKSLIDDIGEHFPGLNIIYFAFEITYNPFDSMKKYSY